MQFEYDFLVLGSGIAGLWFALRAAAHGSVGVVTKRDAEESNTRYAQGGVAGVLAESDSFDSHARDTEIAGAGLCDPEAVRVTVTEGPARIRDLIEIGTRFDRREGTGEYDLGREGGHSHRRVLHAGDVTGAEIQRAVIAAARANPRIAILEHHLAIDLITARRMRHAPISPDRCLGAYVLDCRTNEVRTLLARATVLATGGIGKVYLYTSNPDIASGDGIAMAYRAGATIRNMEFVQFHPTTLYHSQARTFLISEALRGEGGELVNARGEPFMKPLHPMGSLAPRDIVARGIDLEMKRTGADCVFLDMTGLDRDFLPDRFPNIHTTLMRYGIDMRERPIPVVPACHYSCGGVRTGLHGETDIPGLYAVGETSCTGLHGANRLASNSLLEGLVYAERAAEHAATIVGPSDPGGIGDVQPWNKGNARVPDEAVVVTQNWDEIRRSMWNYVGIVRTTRRLLRARRRIDLLMAEIADYYWEYEVDRDLIELRNIAMVAKLIIESALRRRESRGLHYTLDYPEPDASGGPRSTDLTRLELEGVHWLRRLATAHSGGAAV